MATSIVWTFPQGLEGRAAGKVAAKADPQTEGRGPRDSREEGGEDPPGPSVRFNKIAVTYLRNVRSRRRAFNADETSATLSFPAPFWSTKWNQALRCMWSLSIVLVEPRTIQMARK